MVRKISHVLVGCTCTNSGDILKEFGKLKALKKLDLSHNRGIGESFGVITSIHLGSDELSLRLQHENPTAFRGFFVVMC